MRIFKLIKCIRLFPSLIEVYIQFTIKDRVDLLTAFAINSLWPNLWICYLCDPGKMTPMKMFRRKMPLEKAPPKKLSPQETFQENFPREICPQVKFVLFISDFHLWDLMIIPHRCKVHWREASLKFSSRKKGSLKIYYQGKNTSSKVSPRKLPST